MDKEGKADCLPGEIVLFHYPLKGPEEGVCGLGFRKEGQWFKGEVMNYGAIYAKKTADNERWVFRIGEYEIASNVAFEPSKSHVYTISRPENGEDAFWNETLVTEGSSCVCSFNGKPTLLFLPKGCENIVLPDDLTSIDWITVDCGVEYGRVLIARQGAKDCYAVTVEDERFEEGA
jgi:hypothetical protein